MSADKRERPRERHQSPSMSELLASCAAAQAVSTPPEQHAAAPDGEAAEEPAPLRAPAAEHGERRRDAA